MADDVEQPRTHYTLEYWHHENYSGEHREWIEHIKIPVGNKLVAEIQGEAAQTIATLRADLAKAVEGLEGALGGLGCRSDCEWLHPDGSKCDCGNRERKLIAQSLIKELRP